MCLQRTTKNIISATGVGVHSGKTITINLKPAPANTGVIFKRTDTTPHTEIPALNKFVSDTKMSTCISKNNIKIATIEHLLSAIAGLGIDNLLIEIDNAEVPIMDGSASPFTFLLKSAGIAQQKNHYKKFLKIKQAAHIKIEDKTASLLPFDGFKLNMKIDFNHPEINQNNDSVVFDFSSIKFIHEVARARTFGFLDDIEFLKKQKLILGGNLNNCIVLDKNKTLNPEGLRFHNELARHKILDAIGDLYLFGMPILGHFKGFKSGHALNNLLIKKVLSSPENWEIVSFANPENCPIKFNH